MSALRDRIFAVIGKRHLASFATITEDGRPWVRYVMPIASADLTIRFSTFAGSRKVTQINKNPEVHLTCGVSDPDTDTIYLQIQGNAEFVTTEEERSAYWHDFLKSYFSGPDDPHYGIIRITPYRIEVYDMKSRNPEVWEAATPI